MNLSRPHWFLPLAAVCVIAPEDGRAEDWTRNFRIGMTIALNIHGDFSTSGTLGVPGGQAGPAGVGGVDHIYGDGYVRKDDTGNALGLTSNWGYENPSQLSTTSPQTLTFHSAQSVNVGDHRDRVEDAPYLGFDMAYGGSIVHSGSWDLGWEMGFGILPITLENKLNVLGTFVTTVHQFEVPQNPLGGGNIVLPQAPYHGGTGGLGPLIGDVATALPDETVSGTITGKQTLDVNLYHLRLGPTLHWESGHRWAASVGLGGALGWVNGDYRYEESGSFAEGGSISNSGRFGTSDFVFGGYVDGRVLYHVQENADLFVGAQFMSLTNTKFSRDGREARLDLGRGVYFTVGINWPF